MLQYLLSSDRKSIVIIKNNIFDFILLIKINESVHTIATTRNSILKTGLCLYSIHVHTSLPLQAIPCLAIHLTNKSISYTATATAAQNNWWRRKRSKQKWYKYSTLMLKYWLVCVRVCIDFFSVFNLTFKRWKKKNCSINFIFLTFFFSNYNWFFFIFFFYFSRNGLKKPIFNMKWKIKMKRNERWGERM